MDQLKPILSGFVTHRFWVACGVMAPLLLGGWFTTTAKMRSDTEAGKSRIDGVFQIDNAIRQNSPHPNPESHAGLEKSEEAINAEVVAAWKIQYDQQRQFLVWPEELGKEFIDQVDGYRPIEKLKYTPNDPTNEIDIQYRELYRNYIQAELPKLAEIIGAQWRAGNSLASGDGMGAGMGMPGMGMPGMGTPGMAPGMGSEMGGPSGYGGNATGTADSGTTAVVVWDPADQTRLQSTRFDWRMQGGLPRTLDILYAQENLWVMQALMRIIATTNQGATARYNATVKEIKYIQMGREVGPTTSRVQRLRSSQASGGGMPGMPGMGGDETMGSPMAGYGEMPGMAGMGMEGNDMAMPGMPGMEGGGASAPSNDPVHRRYVDNNYVPIEADRLRGVMETENPSPEDAFLVVAKRMPIRLGLVIDQRKLHNFIAACGNSNLMVEVRQVRVNRVGSGTSSGGGTGGMPGMPGMGMGGMDMGGMDMGGMDMGGSGMGTGGPGMGAMMDEGGGMGMGGLGMGGGSQTTFSDVSPYDLPVEIYGMVYIYNPISAGLKEATSQVTVDTDLDSVPAATAPADAADPAPAGEAAPADVAPAPGAGADAAGAQPAPEAALGTSVETGG